MTNFPDPKPYINEEKIIPKKQLTHSEKMRAVKQALKIIQENKRIIEEAEKLSYENLHR